MIGEAGGENEKGDGGGVRGVKMGEAGRAGGDGGTGSGAGGGRRGGRRRGGGGGDGGGRSANSGRDLMKSATPQGFIHRSRVVSVVGLAGQSKMCGTF